jgi:ketosteroid isomerase-like protein
MSQENVDAFQQAVDAANRGDIEGAVGYCTRDTVFLALRSTLQGGYRGHEGVRALFADNAENFDVWELKFSELRDLGDRVLAIGALRVRGKGSGLETEVPSAGIATMLQLRGPVFGRQSPATSQSCPLAVGVDRRSRRLSARERGDQRVLGLRSLD